MKRLFLLRHAKTEPHSASKEDSERVLLPRGREDAPLMGRYMRKQGYQPELVLCSTAKRTVETLELLLPTLGDESRTEFLDALYLAEPETMLGEILDAADSAKSLLLVGHNPGMEQLASQLSRAPVKRKVQDQYDLMEEKFPTCALAVIDLEIDHWRDARGKSGLLVDFVRPRDVR